MSKLTITAPGKIIITGEHSVVYGYPALVASVNRSVQLSILYNEEKIDRSFFRSLLDQINHDDVITLINKIDSSQMGHSQIKIDSNIPNGCGMGSSAALAVAVSYLILFFAFNKKPSKSLVNEKAFIIEKQMHLDPSGVDNTVVTYGGALVFKKHSDGFSFTELQIKLNKHWWLIYTGRPVESTGEMVKFVRERLHNKPQETKHLLNQIGLATESIIELLQEKNVRTESLLNSIQHNSQLLIDLGVVSQSTSRLIKEIQDIGGYAKISGAGGRLMSSGMILVYHEDRNYLENFCQHNHLELFPLHLSHTGVRAKIES